MKYTNKLQLLLGIVKITKPKQVVIVIKGNDYSEIAPKLGVLPGQNTCNYN